MVICQRTVPSTSCSQSTLAASTPKPMTPRALRVRGGLSPQGLPSRPGETCRSPVSRGEKKPDPHAGTSRAHLSGGSRELEGKGRGERTARQLAGVAPGPVRGRPRTCPGAPGASSLPQPAPALAARTLGSAGFSSKAARTSSLRRRCSNVAP